MSPGEKTRTDKILYLVTQPGCVNCPAAEAVVEEAFEDSDIPVETVNLRTIDDDLEFRLLEEQVFIASTPSIIVDNGGDLKLLYSGEVPTVEGIRRELGVV